MCWFSSSIQIETPPEPENAEPLRFSTVRGITIDFSEELENASDLICFSLESDSIEIDESDLQLKKQREPRISTVRGITIDISEQLENALDLISFTGNSRPRRTITQRRVARSSPPNPAANELKPNKQYCVPSIRRPCPFGASSLTPVLAEKFFMEVN
jgi:hypothetical protein